MLRCRVSFNHLDAPAILAGIEEPNAGAVATFVGLVRASSGSGREGRVERLEYEAYAPMAEAVIGEILAEAQAMFGILHGVVEHRVGELVVGDVAVVVAVATPHRAAAFDACRYVIEELKQRAPIWKREVFRDGAEWVNARP
ncbi:MAG: molybdenum cofactor biosynthesis protein MoaE [Chlorobi bacterium]|nr:molybdenum cofactor biosynthesis protein MoaE [Chlorobiota bacterium]